MSDKKNSLSGSAKRIQKELAEISLEPPTNCSAGPKGDNLYEWVSTIVGPSGGYSRESRVERRQTLTPREARRWRNGDGD